MSALQKLQQELSDLNKRPVEGCSAVPKGDYFIWQATIAGPDSTPYAGGLFLLRIQFPQNYPVRPPKVAFENVIYHLNVDVKGAVSLSILKDGWRPDLTMSQVLPKLRAMLADPEPENALRADLAAEWQQNRAMYDDKARKFTADYAS